MPETAKNADLLAKTYKASSREELTSIYDEWASLYDSHAQERNSAQPGRVAQACAVSIKDRSVTILDVGAGTGMIGEALKAAGFQNLTAFDPSEEMLKVAKGKGAYQSYQGGYLGDRLSFDGNSFDAIVASGIFTVGHVDSAVFPELNRILKPSGKMIFSINTKLLDDVGFSQLLRQSETLNWKLDQISSEFDMMDTQYSAARAVIVELSKLE